ncbi:DUF2971 domain-containing protein [Aliivibrio fischeri]|uniref:DUF2971 domain-containing protein n=1 Tax=Aliivibrio fischeri TaxID=668 RepID=UPI0012D8C012|nr:DUF2971 domain-containing protein [Aliivibrio fischeri]MUI53148.1 DUF2971 domain-containing protein [Aliivibrio fischeri]
MDYKKQSARDLGVKSLYKYRGFEPDNTEYIEPIFKKNEIYFPFPSELNDPFECQFQLSVGDLNDLEYKARHRHRAYELQKHLSPKVTVEEYFKFYSTIPFEGHLARTESIRDKTYQIINAKWGIYSLSSDPLSALMWAHYANNHRGFCIEFSTDNDYFGRAWEVDYVRKIKFLDILDDINESSLFNALLTKTGEWSYESEYRLFSNAMDEVEGLPTQSRPKVSNFPVKALKSIIFGARMSKHDIDIVCGWLDEEHKHIKLKQVSLIGDGSLAIKEI